MGTKFFLLVFVQRLIFLDTVSVPPKNSNLAARLPLTSPFVHVAPPCPASAREARISRCLPACLRRDDAQHPPYQARTNGDAAGCRRCSRGPIRSVGAAPLRHRCLVLARRWTARDEYFISTDLPGGCEHLPSMDVLHLCGSRVCLRVCVRGGCRCVCSCVSRRHRVGWS